MEYDHDIKRSNEIASEALEFMHGQKIPPTPDHFAVWYSYVCNSNPALKEHVKAIIKEKGSISEKESQALYDKYISEERHQELYQKAGDQIHSTIQDVSGLMENVKSATSEYSGTLEQVSSTLKAADQGEDLQKLLDQMVQDTSRMLEHNKMLEKQLDQSSHAMKELQRDMEQIRREAMTDGLTGLSNRKSFDQKIDEMIRESKSSGVIYTLLMMDIDHFKTFNDNYGHQVGDQVLRLVARTLIDGVKGKDFAARYGGEEFAILLPETNLNAGVMVADNLRKAIAAKEVINRSTGEQLGRITISVGVAQHYGDENAESIIERADAALYTAKHNGRNQVAAAPTPHDLKQDSA